jgi:hypothetical protein
MNTQPYLLRAWMLISQWLSQVSLSPVSRRSVSGIGIVALASGLCLLCLCVLPVPGVSALHTLSQSVFHLIGSIPFGDPFPP